jgi:hypothetical protein
MLLLHLAYSEEDLKFNAQCAPVSHEGQGAYARASRGQARKRKTASTKPFPRHGVTV